MIKWLALITMLIDHIGAVFYMNIAENSYAIFRLIGRLSFPLYLYFIVKGIERTRDKKKYFYRVLISGIISQIIMILTFPEIGFHGLNILFSFSIYILFSIILERFGKMGYIFLPLLFILSGITDYSYMGFISFICLNGINKSEFSNKNYVSFACFLIIFTTFYFIGISGSRQVFGAFACLLIFNEKLEKPIFNKKVEQKIMYLAYPLQWIIFYLFSFII